MVGILVSFWDGLFSGAMLVLGSVYKVLALEKVAVRKNPPAPNENNVMLLVTGMLGEHPKV